MKHTSLFSLRKFFRPNLNGRDFCFVSNTGWSKREECWWDGAGQTRNCPRGSCTGHLGTISSKAERALGTCGHPTPPRLTFVLQARVWGGWFSLAPHLFPIKSYKTPIKMVTKQKFSQVQLDWNFLYQFCHLRRLPHTQRKMWFGSFWWPWECFSQLLLRKELLSFQVPLPWNDPTCRQGGEVPCAVLRISCSPLVRHRKWKP